ncbi:MAG: PEP-CTERM sorting domain-containing protein [Microcoleaceae cyanobacterium]
MTGLFKKATVLTGVGIVALGAAAPANAQTIYRDITFDLGEKSFADEVVSYNRGGDDGNYSLASFELFSNPEDALGAPDSIWGRGDNNEHLLEGYRDDVSLGQGGSIVLEFTDNYLTGSGDSSDDLWIFEAGGLTENMFVEISADGQNWSDKFFVGGTQEAGIDIDAYGYGKNDLFSFVRITDGGGNAYEGGWSGADIDAVGALSAKQVPEPATVLGLLAVGALGIGAKRQRKA